MPWLLHKWTLHGLPKDAERRYHFVGLISGRHMSCLESKHCKIARAQIWQQATTELWMILLNVIAGVSTMVNEGCKRPEGAVAARVASAH
jgi:hypothetical protein